MTIEIRPPAEDELRAAMVAAETAFGTGRMQLRVGDGLWVRLVDVGSALSARAYGDDGPVVLEVEDAFLRENSGRFVPVVAVVLVLLLLLTLVRWWRRFRGPRAA